MSCCAAADTCAVRETAFTQRVRFEANLRAVSEFSSTSWYLRLLICQTSVLSATEAVVLQLGVRCFELRAASWHIDQKLLKAGAGLYCCMLSVRRAKPEVWQSSQPECWRLALGRAVPEFFSHLLERTKAGKLPHVAPLARPGKDATCRRTCLCNG